MLLKLKIILPIAIGVLGLVLLVLFAGAWGSKKNAGELDAFAQCLTAKGAVMYGAEWCPHCQNEKAVFGESFRLVKYVECPDNPQLCLETGIQGYPTWTFPDGRKLVGEQGINKLAEASGCKIK
ncbi:MAG TPA: protein disulfide isomerase family protein [Candidatus Paceibacterota bacterium]